MLVYKQIIQCPVKMSVHIFLIFTYRYLISISHKEANQSLHSKVSILTYDEHSVFSDFLYAITDNSCIYWIKMITCYYSSCFYVLYLFGSNNLCSYINAKRHDIYYTSCHPVTIMIRKLITLFYILSK